MKLKVLFFAGLREGIGAEYLTIELPLHSTVGDLRKHLGKKHPSLADSTYMVALNHSYCDPSSTITEGDEVALIPPVSGG